LDFVAGRSDLIVARPGFFAIRPGLLTIHLKFTTAAQASGRSVRGGASLAGRPGLLATLPDFLTAAREGDRTAGWTSHLTGRPGLPAVRPFATCPEFVTVCSGIFTNHHHTSWQQNPRYGSTFDIL
jgi:hypothetical protein